LFSPRYLFYRQRTMGPVQSRSTSSPFHLTFGPVFLPPWFPPPPPQKPVNAPNLTVGIGPGKSTNCLVCTLTIDPTISSSTVVLSRDILGKVTAPAPAYPPSNLAEFVPSANHREYPEGPPDNEWCNGGCLYVPPHNSRTGGAVPPTTLSWANGTLLSDDTDAWMNNNVAYANHWRAQQQLESAHKLILDQRNASVKMVRIWNPSDDPTDPAGSIQVNWNNHGALTRLFLKPTIPFTVSFTPGIV
jgi:hypothetical protein